MTKHTSTPEEQREFYRQFIQPGDLVFDIGAWIGQRTQVFLNIGARVVAVEPLPHLAFAMRSRGITVVEAACSNQWKRIEILWIDDDKTYMSTVDIEYGERCQPTHGNNYTRSIEVSATCLDEIISMHGVPSFVKIDVEGHEPQVLAGLSTPVQALSFEVHNFAVDKALRCIERLDELGNYTYTYSPRESMVMESWPPNNIDLFGDVYATLS